MVENPVVSLIIPVWGNFELTDACLKAIEENTPDPYEVIIVDNTNAYDLPDYARHVSTILHNAENLGFGGGSNQGVDHARADLILFFNCDAAPRPGWLPPLLAALDDPEVVMAGPRIVHPDGSLQTSGGIRTWHGQGSAGGEELKVDVPTCDVDGVTGACMIMRKDIFNKLGQFDTNIWNGWEDVDLCLATREAGFRIRYVAESTISHVESGTGPERWSRVHQNIQYVNQKWGNR